MGKKATCFSAVKNALKSSSSSRELREDTALKQSCKKTDETKPGKEKRRWSFGGSTHADVENQRVKAEAFLEKSPTTGDQRQNKHALAIAAATAVAAEAAVAAAHAAAEVVRLTGNMQAGRPSSYDGSCSEVWAAIRIQTAFRGYLARKTLRALRGLVRLQTLVRGHAVRKQATVSMRCMQALVRVQTRVRARRLQMLEEGQAVKRQIWQHRQQELLMEKANEWNDSLRSWEEVEAQELLKQEAALKRERALPYAFAHQLWRSPNERHNSKLFGDIGKSAEQLFWGWSWLERWMAARPSAEARMLKKDSAQLLAPMENAMSAKKIGGIAASTPDAKGNLPISIINSNTEMTPKRKPSSPNDPTSGGIIIIKKGASSTPPATQREIHVKLHRSASPRGVAARLAVEEGESGMSTARSGQSMYLAAGGRRQFRTRKSSIAGSSIRDDDSLISSPAVPNYMITTQSARAKARALSSSPRGGEAAPGAGALYYARRRLSFPSINSDSLSSVNDASLQVLNKRPIHQSRSCSAPPNTTTMRRANSETLAH